MKYKSDDPEVQKAMNQSTRIMIVPFFGTLIVSMVGGMVLVDQLPVDGIWMLAPIFGSIGLAALVGHRISGTWFRKALHAVDNKRELYERSVRLGMLFESKAQRVLQEEGIQLGPRLGLPAAELPEKTQVFKGAVLLREGIQVKGELIAWERIVNFSINRSTKTGKVTGVILQFANEKNRMLRVPNKQIEYLEYHVDRYWRAERTSTKA